MTDGTDPGGRSPDEIEREIDQERGRLAHTADELQDRLSVGSMVDEAMYRAQEDGGDILRSFGQTLRENPIPVALIGVGLAWLMAAGQRAGGDGGGGRVRVKRVHEELYDDEWLAEEKGGYGTMSAYGGPRSEHLRPARPGGIPRGGVDWGDDDEHSAGERLGGSARSAVARMREAAPRGGDIDRMIEEQPLVAGALALALGAAIGALLPNTRTEDRTMGDRAEDLRHQAAEAAAEEGAKARRVAEAAAGEAGRMADETAADAESGIPSGRGMVERAEERTREAAERVSSAAEDEARRQDLGRSADPGRE